jgi:hypothetical protein
MIWLLSAATLGWVVRSLKYPPKSAGPEEIRMATALARINYSRRMVSRVETGDDVWVYWSCGRMDDVSRVCDLSVGGLFLSTPTPRPVGKKAKLDFLVREGQIRAEAVVQHLIPNGGVGLKFTAITDRDCPNLVALMNRMRTLACPPTPRAPLFVAPSH